MKNSFYGFILASVVLAGVGCRGAADVTLDLPTTPPSEPSVASPPAVNADAGVTVPAPPSAPAGEAAVKAPGLRPYYIAYTPEGFAKARAEGRPIVLYFWAVWCPICKAEEPRVKARIEASGLPTAGFRVDFDTQDDLKRQYRIPYQHTTVFLNARGEEVERFSGPTDDVTFNAALRAAAQ